MTGREIAEVVMLSLGVAATLLCCAGLVAMRTVYDRLHYVSAAGTVGPAAILAAVLLSSGFSAPGIKAIVVTVLIMATGPVLTHSIARAARMREHGHARSLPDERVGER